MSTLRFKLLPLLLLSLPAFLAFREARGATGEVDEASGTPPLVSFADLRRDPAAFAGQHVRFVLQVHGLIEDWEPWLSSFGPTRHVALEGWADDRFPWEKTVYEDRATRIFVRRDTPLERRLRDVEPYTRVELSGHVREIFLDEPWIEVEEGTFLLEHLTEGTLLHVTKARDLALRGQFDLALEQYERAEAAPLPAHARRELERQVRAVEARREAPVTAPLGRPGPP